MPIKLRLTPKFLALLWMILAILLGGCSTSKIALKVKKKDRKAPGQEQALTPYEPSQQVLLSKKGPPKTESPEPAPVMESSRQSLISPLPLPIPSPDTVAPPQPETQPSAISHQLSASQNPPETSPQPETPPASTPPLVLLEKIEEVESLVSPEDIKIPEKPSEEPEPLLLPLEDEMTVELVEPNDRVKGYIQKFQTSRRGLLERALQRATRYLPLMREIFQDEGLPKDLVNLAFIESAFNPYAYSRAGAAGIWQLMKPTGRLLGLRIDWWLDERRDPEKSTRAAAKYLKALFELFKTWPLAIAGYNAGDGTVLRALKKSGTNDFWTLRLPLETQLFVPAFMAVTTILKDPEQYGFIIPPEEPLLFDVVELEDATDLRLLARSAGVSLEEIRDLNPELSRFSTPPHYPGYRLRLPYGTRETFLTNFAKIPKEKRVSWLRHKIKRGETLSSIARRYGAPIHVIMELNGIKNKGLIRGGGHLLIPVPYGSTVNIPPPREEPRSYEKAIKTRSKPRLHKELKYVVKPGDTLWAIAKEFSVSLEDLYRWNRLSPKSILKPGQRLRIRVNK